MNDWNADDGDLWIHLSLTDPDAAEWLSLHSELDSAAIESLLAVESRPRVTRVANGALIAFRGVNLNEGATPDDMIGIRVWLDEHRVVSTERRGLRSVGDVVDGLAKGEGPTSATEVITELARRLVSRMSDTVDNLEEQIADLEDQTLNDTKRETRFALANLRRQLIALRRYLAPQREALASFLTLKFPWLTDNDRLL